MKFVQEKEEQKLEIDIYMQVGKRRREVSENSIRTCLFKNVKGCPLMLRNES